ncbi:hypothetical protein IT396_02380 [Candidatus Nomurabacteria bacterium]|nr:hypothetical protein [Candidatus Nomurabacteria bacterium]
MRNPFRLPYTRRGQRTIEYGIIAVGIIIAILVAGLAVKGKPQQPELDRLGLLIELTR